MSVGTAMLAVLAFLAYRFGGAMLLVLFALFCVAGTLDYLALCEVKACR